MNCGGMQPPPACALRSWGYRLGAARDQVLLQPRPRKQPAFPRRPPVCCSSRRPTGQVDISEESPPLGWAEAWERKRRIPVIRPVPSKENALKGREEQEEVALRCVSKCQKTLPLHSLFSKPFVRKTCIQLWEIISAYFFWGLSDFRVAIVSSRI